MTRAITLPGQTVIFDYGEVISLTPSAADREVIAGLAEVGCDSEPFWRAYFAHRDGLDQGRAGVAAYWQAIAGDVGASWDDARVHELWAADFRSWLAEAGAVQPAGNWLPDSLTRTFPRHIAPAAAFAPPDPAPATASWPGYTTPTATSPAVRVAARGSRLLAETPIDSPGVTPGSPPPPGDAPDRARPGGRNRPRRLLVLACAGVHPLNHGDV